MSRLANTVGGGLRAALFTFLIALSLAAPAIAQTCQPAWDNGFDLVLTPPAVGDPGLNGSVSAMTIFDDGTGPALYAGGSFTTAGGVSASHMAKWDGSTWSPLGSGINGHVRAMTIFDDGSGPALFAGGQFATAGGSPAHNIARWNGCDCSTPADLNGDGVVNGADLATLLANWGVAP